MNGVYLCCRLFLRFHHRFQALNILEPGTSAFSGMDWENAVPLLNLHTRSKLCLFLVLIYDLR